MFIKYTGLTPVTNIYGDWKPGEIKNVEKDISGLMGFEKVEAKKAYKTYVKPIKENLSDKSEKKSKYIKKDGAD